ncbi:MAG: BON domain-containing protein [Acidobacteria bacterium]|nr:BON domain-containing protein [Acidobacteriota bacterium]MCI0666115.1 BON domain-containing protein [Acidobacteriota bacterium]
MKKIILFILSFLLLSTPATLAESGQSTDTMIKKETTPKAKKEKAPKSDTEVQKCIMDKFSNSEKLRPQGFSVTVSNGEATLTGNAQNAGSKGAATRIAQSCGAKSVDNNITAPAIPRPKKSDSEKKS